MTDPEIQQLITTLVPILDQKIKESHSTGLETGGKEVSNLVDTILHRIEPVIEKSIEKHVNGKIRAIDVKIDAYIVSSEKWREEVTPSLRLVENAQVVGATSIGFLKVISYIGVACGFVYAFFKWIK